MKILVVGQNPAFSSKNPSVPFLNTKSAKTLDAWLSEIGDEHTYLITNASFEVTPSGKRPKVTEADVRWMKRTVFSLQPDAILTLGKFPTDVARKAGLGMFELPHPSGLNRKINDKRFLAMILDDCRKWLAQLSKSAVYQLNNHADVVLFKKEND